MKGYQILEIMLVPLRKYLGKNSINEKELERIIPLLKNVTILSSLIYRQKIDGFQRVTVNDWIPDVNGRVEYIKHLKYPPKEYIKKYGRANLIGQSVLYATFDYITALSEMRPDIGNTITVSFWKLKSDYALSVTPIYKNTTKDGVVHNELSLRANVMSKQMLKQYDENVRMQIDIIVKFIADAFSKDVEDGNHFDYYLSAYYANKLFYEFENETIDAILYPSVRQSLTLSNIALKPEIFDKYYELDKVEESVILSKPSIGSRGWNMRGTGYSKTFTDEKIIWE